MQPRRSVLYMPGANARAMEKARGLDCDTIIFDLEDAVSPDAKAEARVKVAQALASGDYGHRELVVRCNGLETQWGMDDIVHFASAPVAALLFPKIEDKNEVLEIVNAVDQQGGAQKKIWLMVETPLGVLNVAQFSAHERVEVLVMGTSDLVKELRAAHTPTRSNLAYALQHCVLAARSLGKDILDGVHLDFRNMESFEPVCRGGREMGFDGKTLIHPAQIEVANRVFGYSEDDIQQARRVLTAWQKALDEGKGVAVLDDKLVENLHAAEAERVVAFARVIAERG